MQVLLQKKTGTKVPVEATMGMVERRKLDAGNGDELNLLHGVHIEPDGLPKHFSPARECNSVLPVDFTGKKKWAPQRPFQYGEIET